MPNTSAHPDPASHWVRLLQAAARLQAEVEGTVVVGGTAASLWAGHRYSYDADHVLIDLQDRFDSILNQLEQMEGWSTARTRRPVLILGALDGIYTGLRQLLRPEPLDTTILQQGNIRIRVPTYAEILRVKGYLLVKRNAARDYIDYVELARHASLLFLQQALASLDTLYTLPGLQSLGSEASVLHELGIRLGAPSPQDLATVQWHDFQHPRASNSTRDWDTVRKYALAESVRVLQVHDKLLEAQEEDPLDSASRLRPPDNTCF